MHLSQILLLCFWHWWWNRIHLRIHHSLTLTCVWPLVTLARIWPLMTLTWIRCLAVLTWVRPLLIETWIWPLLTLAWIWTMMSLTCVCSLTLIHHLPLVNIYCRTLSSHILMWNTQHISLRTHHIWRRHQVWILYNHVRTELRHRVSICLHMHVPHLHSTCILSIEPLTLVPPLLHCTTILTSKLATRTTITSTHHALVVIVTLYLHVVKVVLRHLLLILVGELVVVRTLVVLVVVLALLNLVHILVFKCRHLASVVLYEEPLHVVRNDHVFIVL